MAKVMCVVYWKISHVPTINKIRDKFGIPYYTTVNGESPCEIDEADMPLLEECQNRGFLSIRHKKWRKNGGLYSIENP